MTGHTHLGCEGGSEGKIGLKLIEKEVLSEAIRAQGTVRRTGNIICSGRFVP